jgi:hypothetical protein
MDKDRNPLLEKIENILRGDTTKMFSREEILNLMAATGRDNEIEHLLAELEVSSSTKEGNISDVYATCRGGTVYYKWNKPG